ncbi:MAG: branched-chain amino acid transport system substrate-binding protein [Acidobacteriaceae bacterium]|nr:branched-chain amino acid transport system substrate-binding protein [Acidobacteriaceae bacterium]
MTVSRRDLLAGAAGSAVAPSVARAQDKQAIRIGVLADMNGPYADFSGQGAVIAARLAAEEFGDGMTSPKVEILSADHQNKPDISVSIARGWIDTQHVDAVVECSTSGSALALQSLMREKERILLITVAGSSDITGKSCSPFGFHFNCDTYALAHTTGRALTQTGGDSWFFITVDYAFGHALERDATRFVIEGGGKVLGSVTHPLGTADFSSYLVAAKTSGAKVIAFCNAGADAQNAIKQAAEFGLGQGGERLAALLLFVTDVLAIGLPSAQGLVLSNSFYWDLNEATRAWTKRFRAQKDRLPSMNQAAVYAGVRHYVRAVQASGREAKGAAAAMRALPVNDMFNQDVRVREDGRVLSKMYLMEVKNPAASRSPDDVYKILANTVGEQAFRPLAESDCPLIRK